MPVRRSCSGVGRRLATLIILLFAAASGWGVDVLTVHYNNARTGANTAETVLNQNNVNVGAFGKLYTRTLDGYNYAQPLYVSGVTNIGPGGGTHNVVYVATEHNSIYAFDADDNNGSIPAYWTRNFGPSVPYGEVYTNGDTNITPEVGITGTPVIDKASNTLYVVSFTKDAGPVYNQRLHAIDLSDGSEKLGGPKLITYSNTYAGHVIAFDPLKGNQRPGLALANGSIYIAWASFGDIGLTGTPENSYHGWVMRYDAISLAQQAVFNTSPTGTNPDSMTGINTYFGSGIWQVGCGPGVDSLGNVYLITGNGACDTDVGGVNYGETALKFNATLGVTGFFTPNNKDQLNNNDQDLGVCGHVLIDLLGAHPHLMIHGGKEGKVYVLDRDSMGGFHAGNDNQILQTVQPNGDEMRSTPVYWNGPSGGRIFVSCQGGGGLYALSLSVDGVLSATPVATGHLLDNSVYRGSHMVLSSNGTAGGVIWSFSPTIGDPIHQVGPGVFRAFNADTLQEIYNSQQNSTRDNIGNYPKYVPPTVANGRVYVPTSSGQFHVFGLVPTNPNLSVAITSPVDNASATEPANFTLKAAATISGGSATVASVSYVYGITPIGSSTVGPDYAVNWTSVAGTYTLFALVTDSTGATATSSPIHVTVTASANGGTGTILRQEWDNIGSLDTVLSLTSNALYPGNPTFEDYPTLAEGPTYNATRDAYGSRMAGYVYPPVSGGYVFSIASDDNSELWLSTDDNPANKLLIASVPQWTGPREWTKFPAQQSVSIVLVGGQRYYIEALQKDGGGGDNLAVAWQVPTGGPSGQFEGPIIGAHLSPAAAAHTPAYGLPYRGTMASLNVPATLGTPPATLSATGVFSSLSTLTPNTGIIPYQPNTPLWSDNAIKSRWIALPATARIGFAANGEWTFPGGTVFIKHFEISTDDTAPNDPTKRKRLETRLLVLDNTGANGYGITYKWNVGGTDADLVTAAGLDEDVQIATAGAPRTQTWHYPSQTECLQCHTTYSGFVLGVKTRQLNGNFAYPSPGQPDNQLRTWNYLRMFTTDIGEGNIAGFSKMVAVTDFSTTLENQVKSYIDANCAQCHRPASGLGGWDARYDTPMASQGIINGVPAHGDLGATGAKIVLGQDPAHSVLRLRMASLTTGVKMPPLARNLVDTNALAVVDQWINSLPGTPINNPPTVAAAASATPNPVTGTTTALSVTGADDGGEPALTYTWAATAGPAAVGFSGATNGTNAAKNMTATFSTPGTYTLQATISDGSGTTTSSVIVNVDPTLASIVVTPVTPAVATGAFVQFTATAKDQFGVVLAAQPALVWTVGGGGSIGGTGLFTAGATAGGPFTVTATSGGTFGTTTVTVTANVPPIASTGAAATPNPVTALTTSLSVMGSDDGGEPALTYTWASTAGPALVGFSGATNGTNAAKNMTATFSKAGSYTLQVTIADGGGGTAISSVVVNVSQTLTTITVAPASTTVATTLTGQFTATAKDQFGDLLTAQPTLTWTVSGGGTISATGLFTAGASVGGPFTVTAANGGKSGTASVSVAAGSPPTVVTAATATPNPVTAKTTTLSVMGGDDGGEPALTYSWATTGATPAPVTFSAGNGTNAGKSLTATFAKAGTYTLQATITDGGGLSVTSSVGVNVSQTLTAIVVMPGSTTVATTLTGQFIATATDQFGDGLAPQPAITWTVSGGGTISATGLFTAGASAGGPFTVTAANGGKTGTASVSVAVGSPPTVVAVATATPNPVTATTTGLTVLGGDDGGEPALTYLWATTGAPPAPVTFSAGNGANAGKSLTATFTKAGSYTLQATITDGGGLSVTSSVVVTVSQTVTTLAVAPASRSVAAGGTGQFTATATDQFGNALALQPAIAWTVSGGGTISSSGLFTAGASAGGPFTVTATNGSTTGTASVTVTATTTPTVTGVTPMSGGAGTVIVITGTNLGAATGVTIGGVALTNLTIAATQITATVPINGLGGAVVVATPAGSASSAAAFNASASSSSSSHCGLGGLTAMIGLLLLAIRRRLR